MKFSRAVLAVVAAAASAQAADTSAVLQSLLSFLNDNSFSETATFSEESAIDSFWSARGAQVSSFLANPSIAAELSSLSTETGASAYAAGFSLVYGKLSSVLASFSNDAMQASETGSSEEASATSESHSGSASSEKSSETVSSALESASAAGSSSSHAGATKPLAALGGVVGGLALLLL